MATKTGQTALLCDFDGTATYMDVGALVLDAFATGDWRSLEESYETGERPIEDVLRSQFGMVRASRSRILELVDKRVTFRKGFRPLVEYCKGNGIHFALVSYGLDLYINHLLDREGLKGKVGLHAARARLGPGGILISFPRPFIANSSNIKEDMVEHFRRRQFRVLYAGDGVSDFPAAKAADVCFAVRGSKLAELCGSRGVRYNAFASFGSVEAYLKQGSAVGPVER